MTDITEIRKQAGFETHLMDWLGQGYEHCQHGSKDWCHSYLDSAARYIAALETAIFPERRTWRPIDSAPKDGTTIILGYQDKRGWFAARSALWMLVHPKNPENEWAWAWVCPSMGSLVDQRATHWSPLNPPEQETTE